jgi:hypothetical protein
MVECTAIKQVIEIEIGSLLSNTLIMIFVTLFILYLLYLFAKYRRLYKFKGKGDKKLKGDDEKQ